MAIYFFGLGISQAALPGFSVQIVLYECPFFVLFVMQYFLSEPYGLFTVKCLPSSKNTEIMRNYFVHLTETLAECSFYTLDPPPASAKPSFLSVKMTENCEY